MEIQVRTHSGVPVIRLRGDLKLGEPVDGLKQTLGELQIPRVVVNLSEVPMVDSSGIGLLVRTLTTAKQRGGDLRLVSPSKLTVQSLKIVGLLNLFQIFEDDQQAVASFNQQ